MARTSALASKSGTFRARMPNLRSQLDTLASSFARDIIAVIQGASLHELVGAGGRDVVNGRGPRLALGGGGQPDPLSIPNKKRGKPGRLPRRSIAEIVQVLDKIVLPVKTHKEGMRAEPPLDAT